MHIYRVHVHVRVRTCAHVHVHACVCACTCAHACACVSRTKRLLVASVSITIIYFRPDEGSIHPPESEYIQALFNDMKSWEELFNSECERFMGDVLLSCEDNLLQLNKCVDMWIQTAVNIFHNHPTTDSCSHPQHVAMMELNTKVEKLHSDFKLRMSGENGVAKIFIQILNNLDTWYGLHIS